MLRISTDRSENIREIAAVQPFKGVADAEKTLLEARGRFPSEATVISTFRATAAYRGV